MILIIGILAAIALPAFLGQRSKGQDADAKSDARNLVSPTRVVLRDQEDLRSARPRPATTSRRAASRSAAGAGKVDITDGDADTYTVVADSESGGSFTIEKNGSSGQITRTCSKKGEGGCPSGGKW